MKRLGIIGSGNMGQLIAHYALSNDLFELAGFYDDLQDAGIEVGIGSVLGKTCQVHDQYQEGVFDEVLIAIGYNHFALRKALFEQLQGRVPFARLIHPTAYVDPSSKIAEGVVILPGCIIDRNVVVEENVFLNIGSVIAHDSSIGAHSFLAPGVKIAGFTNIGQCCFLGVGSTISSRIRLCDGSYIGAGAVVIRDIGEPDRYVGVPARPLVRKVAEE